MANMANNKLKMVVKTACGGGSVVQSGSNDEMNHLSSTSSVV